MATPKNRLLHGNDVPDANALTWTNGTGGALVKGDVALIGGGCAILDVDIANGGSGTIHTGPGIAYRTSVKTTGQAWAQGVKLYWDDTNKKWTTTSSGNTLGAYAKAAALSAASVADIVLLELPGS